MHAIQQKLQELSQTQDLSSLSLRQIGRLIGEDHPQKVKHHMQKLGLLSPTPGTKISADQSKLVSIPLLGLANCGPATIYADSHEEQYLQVSQRLIPQHSKDIFAVQAVGDSMNQADIKGGPIDNGDYVIVDADEKNFQDGDYILSIINGMANVKRFSRDGENNCIVLTSESTENYPPIFIHEDDISYFMASGKVINVLKQPKKEDLDDVVPVSDEKEY